MSQILGGMVVYPLDQAADMLRFYRDLCPTLPDEAEAYAALLTTPEGVPVAAMLLGYNGPIEDGQRCACRGARLRQALGRSGCPDALCGAPDDARCAERSTRLASLLAGGLHRNLSDGLIDAAVDTAARLQLAAERSPVFYMHGAGIRVPVGETAFSARRAQWDFDAIGQWTDAAESATHIAWVREAWAKFEQHLQGRVYINHVADDDKPEKVRASFGENHARLREIKSKFDPANLFRMNANIGARLGSSTGSGERNFAHGAIDLVALALRTFGAMARARLHLTGGTSPWRSPSSRSRPTIPPSPAKSRASTSAKR